MLTVLVAADDDAIALAETLAALVPAAVDGLARRVAVITSNDPGNDVLQVIDASGADHAQAAGDAAAMWRSQIPVAGAEWRLCLVAGMTPVGDWADVVARHISRPKAGSAVFSLAGGVGMRLASAAGRFAGRVHPPSGLLIRGAWRTPLRVSRLRARLEDRRNRS